MYMYMCIFMYNIYIYYMYMYMCIFMYNIYIFIYIFMYIYVISDIGYLARDILVAIGLLFPGRVEPEIQRSAAETPLPQWNGVRMLMTTQDRRLIYVNNTMKS